MKHETILFTDVKLDTAGMVVVSRGVDDAHWSIDRHAHEQGDYVHAFRLQDNGFQPLHYNESGMGVNDAIERL